VMETRRPLLSGDSIGAIADITRSTGDAERAFGAVGIKLERKPVSHHAGAVIVPSAPSHIARTLRGERGAESGGDAGGDLRVASISR
jgi:hypothetical protein